VDDIKADIASKSSRAEHHLTELMIDNEHTRRYQPLLGERNWINLPQQQLTVILMMISSS